jgi:hypothetical protein
VMDILSFENMKVRLNIFNVVKHPLDENECFFLDIIEEFVEDSLLGILIKDPLEACMTHFGFDDFNAKQYIDKVNCLLDTIAIMGRCKSKRN